MIRVFLGQRTGRKRRAATARDCSGSCRRWPQRGGLGLRRYSEGCGGHRERRAGVGQGSRQDQTPRPSALMEQRLNSWIHLRRGGVGGLDWVSWEDNSKESSGLCPGRAGETLLLQPSTCTSNIYLANRRSPGPPHPELAGTPKGLHRQIFGNRFPGAKTGTLQ